MRTALLLLLATLGACSSEDGAPALAPGTPPSDDAGGSSDAAPPGAEDAGLPGADVASPDAAVDDDVAFADARAKCTYKAGALAATTFGPSIAARDIPIDTFVVVSQENRSFDHYFSKLPAFGQPDVDVAKPDQALPDGDGGVVSRFHQTDYCFADTAHDWYSMHACWDNGKNDGFVRVNGARSVGYFDASDLPFYYALAGTFGTSDRYFSPVLSKTGANRLYLYAATSAGSIDNNPGITLTIFDRMSAAGKSWKVYRNGTYSFEQSMFPYLLTKYPDHFKSLTDFAADAAAGTLPNLATIYVGPDEHPPADMQKGQHEVAKVFANLAASPQWGRAAFIHTYDEAGGLFDHVPPPPACAPDDIPPKLPPGATGTFAQYGFRVPLLVASAWSKAHYVSHVLNDHTSILRLLELRFGLAAMSARDANANALLDMFDFSHPSFPKGPTIPVPAVDPAHLCP
jgi:phospholipase C